MNRSIKFALVIAAFLMPLLPGVCLAQPPASPGPFLDALQAQAAQAPAPPPAEPAPAALPDSTAPPEESFPELPTLPRTRPAPAPPAPRLAYDSSVLLVPFGQVQPTLTCAPLRACEIALQPNEKVLGYAVGDSERWLFQRFLAGTPQSVHIVVKPTAWNVGTNLLLGTDRRTYSIALVSPARETTEKPDFRFTSRLAFSYTDDELLDREAAAATVEAATRQNAGLISLEDLHLDYRLAGDTRLSWLPRRVFDDGKRTFIQFGNAQAEAPALLAVNPHGEAEVLNYRAVGAYYVVDGTFEHLRLLVRDGRKTSAAIDVYRLR